MDAIPASGWAQALPSRHELLRLWLVRLFWVSLALVLGGIAAVFSTTVYLRIAQGLPPYREFVRHLLFIGFAGGLVLLLLFVGLKSRPIRRWARFVIPIIYACSLVLVALVKFSPWGRSHDGATMTLAFGGFSFQPSELLKLTVTLYLAQLLCWWRDPAGADEGESRPQIDGFGAWLRHLFSRRTHRAVWPELPRRCVLVMLLPVFLTVVQKDFGSASIILGVGLVTLLLAGVDWRQLAASMALVAVLLAGIVFVKPDFVAHIRHRLDVYFALLQNRPVDDNGAGYQISQSRGALALGGMFGRGYLHSEQKLNRLPVSTEDFVYPIMVEEFGYAGGVAIMLLFLALAWIGLNLANACRDPFNRTVIAGLGLALCIQAMVNIGTTIGTLPVTGLTLPFFSEGGTSIVVSILALGIMGALALSEMQPEAAGEAIEHTTAIPAAPR
jgi:cell division protein FtsW